MVDAPELDLPQTELPQTELPQTDLPQPAVEVERPAEDVGEDDSSILQSVDEQAEAPPVETAQEPTLGDGQMRVLLTYSGDCWTEVTDAGGRRLFFDLGKDGRTVELSGEAPFNVLFGNAENVRIRVNGSERAITAAERRGRTARLSIAGS